jgi:hypothetical protein
MLVLEMCDWSKWKPRYKMKRIYKIAFVSLLFAVSLPLRGNDEFCGIRNTTFLSGESITYKAYYAVAEVYFAGGEAVLSVKKEELNGNGVYHITGTGKSNSFLDHIFKVRDKYQSYIDTGTLRPYKFIRDIHEGGFKKFQNVDFITSANTAVTAAGVFSVPPCVQDVLSSIFYARNIDFNKYHEEDKIPFFMFLDDQVYNMYIRYMGKETIKTRYGTFRAIKFRPLLLKGTIFQGGEKMTVWVSDDANHIPLRVESPISVGKIYADMVEFQNLRYPLSSLVSKR